MNSIKQHLESITIEDFESWQKNTIIIYASSNGLNGLVQLGVNGLGDILVTQKNETHIFETIDKALGKYQELLLNKN